MKTKLETLSTSALLSLYEQHTTVFALEYAAPDVKQSEYAFRKAILEILNERLENEMKASKESEV